MRGTGRSQGHPQAQHVPAEEVTSSTTLIPTLRRPSLPEMGNTKLGGSPGNQSLEAGDWEGL